MYKICKTEESAQRQKMLEDCLLQAMAAKPFDKITISGLCQQAGIPRKAFYRYFSSLQDALLALIDHTLSECNFRTVTEWDGSDDLSYEVLSCYFSYWQSQRSFLDAIVSNNLWPLLIERITVLVDREKPGQDAPQTNDHYEKTVTMHLISYGLMITVLRWHSDGYPCTPQKMAKAAAELLSPSNVSMAKLSL